MRSPLERLRFERKLALLPVLAAAGLAATVWVTIAVGHRSRRDLSVLRDGYQESLESSRDQENLLDAYQRALQDAVVAREPSGLETADSIARLLRSRIAQGRVNPVADTLALDLFRSRFDSYDSLARRVSGLLIAGTPTDSLVAALTAMRTDYGDLRGRATARTDGERSRIAGAYARIDALNRNATLATVLVLVAVVTALALVVRSIERQVRSSLATIARAATHIANGDLRRGIDFGARVELGVIADPFRAICDYIEGIAEAADRLAKGDLSVSITPRSDRDVVALSLRQAIVDRIFMEERLKQSEEHRQAQKMEAIGRLAGGIAHDFNNLLTAIQGHATLLADTLGPDHDGQEELTEVRRSAERAAALTRQLLAYSSKQVLHPRLVDLNAVIRDVSRMLRRMIREDIELRQELGSDLGAVRIDPTQMEQVILNLVLNARDAIPDGGCITLRTAAETVTAEQKRGTKLIPGHYIVLRVEDTGVGMDEDTRERIFEPFFTTKGSIGGTGLGLATVYGIVRQSGGDVRVSSDPGLGTTFEIFLPAEAGSVPEPAEPARPDGAGAAQRGSEVVLVVEDEGAVRRMVVKVLKHSGYRVLEASNGAAALELAGSSEPNIDLLLTDVVMPQMGGRELADSLVERTPGLRVIYMSGYSEDSVLHTNVFMPGTRFIEKPFSPRAVVEKVREVLDAPASHDVVELFAAE